MKLSHLCSAIIIASVAFAGCKKSTRSNNQQSMNSMSSGQQVTKVTSANSDFTASLSGTNEVPSVSSKAGGVALFRISSDSSKIYYTLNLTDADSVMMAHIHYGTNKDNGPIAVWLFPETTSKSPGMDAGPVNGTLKSGVITNSVLGGPFGGKKVIDLIHAMEHDSAYVNVHTSSHPGGEVRGQIEKKAMM